MKLKRSTLRHVIIKLLKVKDKEKSKPKSKDEKNQKKKNHLYKIERVCGNGSFGIVFQGKILHTGETIAIKKVYQDRRFRNREFSIMSSSCLLYNWRKIRRNLFKFSNELCS